MRWLSNQSARIRAAEGQSGKQVGDLQQLRAHPLYGLKAGITRNTPREDRSDITCDRLDLAVDWM
jgi:hypothetical protein